MEPSPELILRSGRRQTDGRDLVVLAAFAKPAKPAKSAKSTKSAKPAKPAKPAGRRGARRAPAPPSADTAPWPADLRRAFRSAPSSGLFTGEADRVFRFALPDGGQALALGLGERGAASPESVRRAMGRAWREASRNHAQASVELDGLLLEGRGADCVQAAAEGILMASYAFTRYRRDPPPALGRIFLDARGRAPRGAEKALARARLLCECVALCRDLVNEPPNVLNSAEYARRIKKDVDDNLPGTGLKILGKKELEKEGMGMFLAVNAGSAHPPRLVHLTHRPAGRGAARAPHVALVGKGLTFDTGGYSIKPAGSIINMKYDMAGSATVYAAFRAAVLAKLPVRLTCLLGITDNAINQDAIMPDSIVTSRKGTTVEILNTDAEGRLVLGDVLDYARSLGPDAIIDAATLTGAVLVALGKEVCGLMGNDDGLKRSLESAARAAGERIWELPVIDPWRRELRSPSADLKNIGDNHYAGAAKAAAFLEHFAGEGIPWAHLDIAGVANAQSHLPYCPRKGASGLMVRTLFGHLASL